MTLEIEGGSMLVAITGSTPAAIGALGDARRPDWYGCRSRISCSRVWR